MKIRFFKLVLAAVLLGGMASCAQEEITRVPAKMALENADEMGVATLTLSNRVDTKSVSFTADGDWYIRIPKDCDWLTVSPSEGTGDATVNFTSTLYEAEVPRTATVAFVCDKVEQKALLKVTQQQKFVIETNVLSTVVPKAGGEYTVNVASNGTFNVSIDAEGSQWLSVVNTTAKAVVFNAQAIDPSKAKNKAAITFTCVEDPEVKSVLNISQKNLSVLLDAKEVIADGVGGSGEATVSTLNVTNWKAESDQDWVTVEKSGDKLLFAIARNSSSAERTAYISAVCDDSADDADVKSVIVVKQYPAADIVDFKFNENGTAEDVSVNKGTVNSFTTGASMLYYDEYAAWGPTVTRGQNKTLKKEENAFWEFDYTKYDAQVADNYTLECVFALGGAHTNVETKAFGATQAGGFAIMIGNSAAGTNNGDGTTYQRDQSIEFIQHNGSGWNFAISHIQPVVGQLYHVFGVWDGETIKCYVDGELKATVGAKGFKHKGGNHYLGVAGNYSSDTQFNGSWNGTVVIARMYDSPLTAEQIKTKTQLNGKIQIVK